MDMDHRRLHGSGRYLSAARFAQVRAAKRERSRRALFLPAELLAEPAWDILLELYLFDILSRRVSEAELAGRTSLPIATSIRWIKVLEGIGLIARTPDPDEPTEIVVSLTPKGLAALDGYFSGTN